jgi:outer membrane lipoprotein SlyB
MKKFLIAIPMIAGLAACDGTTANQGALTGAALGAAAGAAVSGDDDKVQGAIVGGLTGAAAGNYIGQTQAGKCVYQNSAGQRYTAACP